MDDYGYKGQNNIEQAPWFEDRMTGLGIIYQERVIPNIGTMGGQVRELSFNTEGQQRYAYVFVFQGVDDFLQQSLIFERPIPDDKLANVFEQFRRAD